MSPDLIAFLKAWHDWATSGAPDGEPFFRADGLCDCLFDYKNWKVDIDARRLVQGELRVLFSGSQYPFGLPDFKRRSGAETQHECPKRLAWVRARLVEAGELNTNDIAGAMG